MRDEDTLSVSLSLSKLDNNNNNNDNNNGKASLDSTDVQHTVYNRIGIYSR